MGRHVQQKHAAVEGKEHTITPPRVLETTKNGGGSIDHRNSLLIGERGSSRRHQDNEEEFAEKIHLTTLASKQISASLFFTLGEKLILPMDYKCLMRSGCCC
jgi:hypothetical protein